MLTTSSFMRKSRKKAPSLLSTNLRASLAAPLEPCALGTLGLLGTLACTPGMCCTVWP